MTKSYLNLGCGQRFHSAWINVDHVPSDSSVIQHDLAQGIPFPNNSFDVVYHSHLLEHFSRPEGARFLKECSRVLKPGGLLRIAVPDLERIARTYLHALEEAVNGSQEWRDNYDWMML